MWQKSYEAKTQEVRAEQVWAVISDINHWHEWDQAIEYAKLSGKFQTGAIFELKPQKGPKVQIEILECVAPYRFVDLTRFPGAKMINEHNLSYDESGALVLKTTCSVTGPLGFLWRKLVAEGIARDFPIDTQKQIAAAKKRPLNSSHAV